MSTGSVQDQYRIVEGNREEIWKKQKRIASEVYKEPLSTSYS